MKKLLVVVGPTASGKTAFATEMAKARGGELVSADSRQIYRHMDIGTGKDLSENLKFKISNLKLRGKEIGFYEENGLRIWGYDLVEPWEDFSVAQYIQIARKIIRDIWKRGKLPILVGGSGLYIKGALEGIETSDVPRNLALRKSLETKGTGELFELLRAGDPVKAGGLNSSDRKNPRRLVRAIEVAKGSAKFPAKGWSASGGKVQSVKLEYSEILILGLNVDRGDLDKKIEERVYERLKMGFEKEVKKLLKMGATWERQSMQALGYRQWGRYARGEISKEEAIERWIKEEQKYVKRQMIWFKRDKRILWYS